MDSTPATHHLNTYRRHLRDCKGSHLEQSKSGEVQERSKGWKKCQCPIVASGTLAGIFRRASTFRWEWEQAKAITDAWVKAGNWDGKTPAPPPPASTATDLAHPVRITIASAIEAYLASRNNRDIESSTMVKYKTMTNQLQAFADTRGYLMLDQFTVTDMDLF